jgi:hypothetical protein
MDFVGSPPRCGRSVTDFWRLGLPRGSVTLSRWGGWWCIWIWSNWRGLNLSSTQLPRPWSPWESSPSKKNFHDRTGNRTQDLMIRSQNLWPLDHEAGQISNIHLHYFVSSFMSSKLMFSNKFLFHICIVPLTDPRHNSKNHSFPGLYTHLNKRWD